MPITLPTDGQDPWGPILNEAFVDLEESIAARGSAVFSKGGKIATVQGKGTFPVTAPLTIGFVVVRLTTAPAGSDAIFDVQKNAFDGGGTIFTTTAKPTIAVGTTYVLSSPPDITDLVDGDYLTFDVVQPGSTFAGSDLTALVVFT